MALSGTNLASIITKYYSTNYVMAYVLDVNSKMAGRMRVGVRARQPRPRGACSPRAKAQ